MLDDYAANRKAELDIKQLSKDASLIKSYIIETQANGFSVSDGPETIERYFRQLGWTATELNDQAVYRLSDTGDFVGFVEPYQSRYLILHTLKKSQVMDRLLKKMVKASAKLDFAWVAGNYLNLLWEIIIREHMRDKFVSFKFEHQGRFEEIIWGAEFEDADFDDEPEDIEAVDDMPVPERRSSTLSVTSNVAKIAQFLPDLQDVLSDFKAIKMLRFPNALTRGGYDLWDWGKVTYRAPSFLDGRFYVYDVLKFYWQATQVIETRVWYGVERTTLPQNDSFYSITGTPVTFVFPEPLDLRTFQNFITTTFERGQGPFRLWGDPIVLSESKVHVYGMDLHLWQQIYLELTPARFILVLPNGSCGNTVHRLVSNIQRFISPDVITYIGDQRYTNLMREVILEY
jgi:hypothetical protein